MCAKKKSSDKKKILFSDEFYSDISANDMIHAVIVRSPFSYGKIIEITTEDDAPLPEGYILLTYRDIPQKSIINLFGTDIPVLCAGEISYKGEPVAILAGEDKKILEKLKKTIRIKLDQDEIRANETKFSKAYSNLSVSLKDGSLLEQSIASLRGALHNFDKEGEIVAKRKITEGNIEEVFSDPEKAAFIVEGKWNDGIRFKSNRETEGVFCQLKGGYMNVYTPTHWISQLKTSITDITGFDEDKIIVTKTKSSSENTNSLWMNGILAGLAALVVIKTGHPVKLSLSREEQQSFIENSSNIQISHKTAISSNGIIAAMDINIDYKAGAYNPFVAEVLDRLAIAATGIYNCKNVRINAKAYRTHNPPSAPKLSMADSASFFAVENHIQKIADITGFSPVELRQMNKAGGLQKETLPFTFSFGRASDAINAVSIRSDFKRKYTVSRLSSENIFTDDTILSYAPPLRGIGMACAFEGSGYTGTLFQKETASLQLSITEEKKLLVHMLPSSQNIKEVWLKLITDNIDIEKRNIVFVSESTDLNSKKGNHDNYPSYFFGSASIKTILLKKCIEAIKRKKLDGTPFSVKKTLPSSKKRSWNQEEFNGSPYYNTAFGTCTLELELDTCTFREKIRKICVIIDGGKILHPKAAENKIHRAVQHCLSSLVENEMLKAPLITVQFMQSEDEPKQIGNLIYSILPPAYTSALSQAMGLTVNSLPLQTDSIFKLMENENKNKYSKNEAIE